MQSKLITGIICLAIANIIISYILYITLVDAQTTKLENGILRSKNEALRNDNNQIFDVINKYRSIPIEHELGDLSFSPHVAIIPKGDH